MQLLLSSPGFDVPRRHCCEEQYLDDVWRNVRQLSGLCLFCGSALDTVGALVCSRHRKGGGRDISLKIDTAVSIGAACRDEVAYEIYRIIQESTANAMKYGDHSAIDISLTASAATYAYALPTA